MAKNGGHVKPGSTVVHASDAQERERERKREKERERESNNVGDLLAAMISLSCFLRE